MCSEFGNAVESCDWILQVGERITDISSLAWEILTSFLFQQIIQVLPLIFLSAELVLVGIWNGLLFCSNTSKLPEGILISTQPGCILNYTLQSVIAFFCWDCNKLATPDEKYNSISFLTCRYLKKYSSSVSYYHVWVVDLRKLLFAGSVLVHLELWDEVAVDPLIPVYKRYLKLYCLSHCSVHLLQWEKLQE